MKENAGNILLVEDDKSMVVLLKFNLEQAGYSVYPFGNAESALEFCQQHTPNLIISDVQLPGMSGLEFRQALQADARLEKIPFVFLTASAQEDEISRGRKLDIRAYLTKPFKVDALLNKIGSIIQAA